MESKAEQPASEVAQLTAWKVTSQPCDWLAYAVFFRRFVHWDRPSGALGHGFTSPLLDWFYGGMCCADFRRT